ncbi:MAG: type 4a pilus biogenesis protein PilO [Candidatus Omnitrophota bacterium]
MIEAKRLQDFMKQVSVSLNRLDKRTRFLLFFLAFAILFNFYFNKALKPQIKQAARLKSELAGLNKEITELKRKIPSIQEEQKALEDLKKKNQQITNRLFALERELPSSYRISQLLGEFAKQSADLGIDFSFIRPKSRAQSQEEDYTRLEIEMQFDSPYHDFLDYLIRLEQLSAYLSVTDIVIDEMKESSFSGETTVSLVLSTLLKKDADYLLAKEQGQKKETVSNDSSSDQNPFLPQRDKTKEGTRRSKYVLTGITYSGQNSTAIINNEIYRVGDQIEGKWAIKQILQNMVIVKHGRTNEILTLER